MKLLCIVIRQSLQDREGRTHFTSFWENDVICPCRPTKVRAQVFHADIGAHVARMKEKFDVEIRDGRADPGREQSWGFDWKNVPVKPENEVREKLEKRYDRRVGA